MDDQSPFDSHTLLEPLHRILSEQDWTQGMELFQRGHIRIQDTFASLTTLFFPSTPTTAALEVRIKWHPVGRHLLWMECACSKHRSKKKSCEHMVAALCTLAKECPEKLEKVDTKTLAGLFTAKPTFTAAAAAFAAAPPTKEAQEAAVSPAHVTHLQLLGKGPMLRARVKSQSREAGTTHRTVDLSLDAAGQLLEHLRHRKTLVQQIAPIHSFSAIAKMGTQLTLSPDGTLQAQRVIALPVAKSLALPPICAPRERYWEQSDFAEARVEGKFTFVPFPGALPFLGKQFFFVPQLGYWPLPATVLKSAWFETPAFQAFTEEQTVRMVEGGFQSFLELGPIWIHPDLASLSVLHAPQIQSITATEDRGWFYLAPYYQVGGENVPLSELILHYRKKKSRYLKKGNHWIQVPAFLTEYEWELGEDGRAFKVQGLDLFRLEAHLGHYDTIAGSHEVLQKLQGHKTTAADVPLPSLEHTNLTLRDYQQEGLQWAWWLFQNHFHGLLADDMGLGKTHQAMALLASVQKTADHPCRFLVIVPTSVLDHWFDKITQYAPCLAPTSYYGNKRAQCLASLEGPEHVTLLTSYGVLLRDWRSLQRTHWDVVILDEAHLVKNQKTATYRAACKLSAHMRLGLTGTPMENHLRELKNLFDFLLPGYLGSDPYFQRTFLTPIVKHESPEAQQTLQRLIHPFKLRRTKAQVLPELPEKIEDTRFCSLTAEQAQLYTDVIALRGRPLLEQLQAGQGAIPYLHIFATLQLLKQICNHPASLHDQGDYRKHDSGKFTLFQALLAEAIASGQKVVIFSQYLRMLDIIGRYCEDQGIRCVTMTGQTRNRKAVIDQFQTDPTTSVFLGSLLAGGIGIDLTAASVVIHYDRWWNASKENQATDRVHRMGQKNGVQVLKLVTKGTLEEKIDAMIQSKQGLFEQFLEKDEDLFHKLDRKELIQLLATTPTTDPFSAG